MPKGCGTTREGVGVGPQRDRRGPHLRPGIRCLPKKHQPATPREWHAGAPRRTPNPYLRRRTCTRPVVGLANRVTRSRKSAPPQPRPPNPLHPGGGKAAVQEKPAAAPRPSQEPGRADHSAPGTLPRHPVPEGPASGGHPRQRPPARTRGPGLHQPSRRHHLRPAEASPRPGPGNK